MATLVPTVVPPGQRPEPGTQLQVRAKELGEQALAVKELKTEEDYKAATKLFQAQAALIKETAAFFDGLKKPAHAAWRALCDRESAITGTAEKGKKHLGALIMSYEDEQKRLREIEEAKQRQAIASQSQESVIEEAIALESEGDIEGALAKLEEGPGFVPAPSVPATVSRPKGMIRRENWKARLKGKTEAEQKQSFLLLVKAVVDGKVPILAVTLDWSFLHKQAKAMKKLLDYPGIEAFDDPNLSSRS